MKRPPWLLVAPGSIHDGTLVTLDPAEARHATGSLRLRSGDEVVIADGYGWTAAARLVMAGKNRVDAEVISSLAAPRPAGEGVTLALAVIEPKAMDWAVQKAVEIGVRALQPIITDRTQGGRTRTDRTDHWRRLARQALKQCRRPWAMEIPDVRSVTDFVGDHDSGGVVADPDGTTLGKLRYQRGGVLAVGPEGGFSAAEDELFRDRQWARLRLGAHILRSETAAIVGGAMLIARDEDAEAIRVESADE